MDFIKCQQLVQSYSLWQSSLCLYQQLLISPFLVTHCVCIATLHPSLPCLFQVMMMKRRVGKNDFHPALITLCTSWQFSGKSCSPLSHQLNTGTAGHASSCLFPLLVPLQRWPVTWPHILAAPSVSKTLSPPWCLWPLAPPFQVGTFVENQL